MAVARGLAPVGVRSAPKVASTVRLMNLSAFMGDCYAVERGQAPSPQGQYKPDKPPHYMGSTNLDKPPHHKGNKKTGRFHRPFNENPDYAP